MEGVFVVGKIIDLTGHRFGKLVAIEPVYVNKLRKWRCKCDCGGENIVVTGKLRNGDVKSCGCEEGYKKHGMSYKRPYTIWRKMIQRCTNEKSSSFKNYGGRGISVCDKWLTFNGFWKDMKNGYNDNLTIDRIDNNGDYEPSNCRWATRETQNRNMRKNIYLTFNNKTKTLNEWANETGICWRTLKGRLDRGWAIEKALTQKPDRKPWHIGYRRKNKSQ